MLSLKPHERSATFTHVKAIVIGAGIGGIAAAIRTAHLGYAVDVYETAKSPGGKLSSFEQDGYRFDRGPSLFTMPNYVDELFELCGENPKDHFTYSREDIVCRYFWESGERLIAFADPTKFSKEAASVFQVDENCVANALQASAEKYEVSGRTFLEKPLHLASTWLNLDVAKTVFHLGKMDLMESMHDVNKRLLKNPRLVQLFDRFATYNGSNPYRAPGILTVIPTFEHLLGTYLPKGGMIDITNALVGLAERQGVKFHFNAKVENIQVNNKKIRGIQLSDGSSHSCDLLVCNTDVYSFYEKLLPAAKKPKRTLEQERSTSALIFYWGVKGEFPELGLHNIFFSKDYKAEFEALQEGKIADDFTVYINATSKYIKGESPAGKENWFVMVNAPYDRGQNWDQELSRVKKLTLEKLSRNLGVDLENALEIERTWTPPGIASDTGSHLGALYGSSSNSKWAAFLRHRNQSSEFKNLYFVGGSVHPGGGVPLALLSAKIAASLMPSC